MYGNKRQECCDEKNQANTYNCESKLCKSLCKSTDIITPSRCLSSTLPCSYTRAEAVSSCNNNDNNKLVNYGKIRAVKTRTQLYSYDYLSRNNSAASRLKSLATITRDPNEFYYLDKLYNSSTSSSESSTRARICSHPAPLPVRCHNSSFLSSMPRKIDIEASRCHDEQNFKLDSCRNGSYETQNRLVPPPSNISISAGNLCDSIVYKPYTNYLEIGIFRCPFFLSFILNYL